MPIETYVIIQTNRIQSAGEKLKNVTRKIHGIGHVNSSAASIINRINRNTTKPNGFTLR